MDDYELLSNLKDIADRLTVQDNENKHGCHCGRKYKNKRDMLRHQRTVHLKTNNTCQNCGSTFSRKDSLNRHLNSCTKQRKTEDKYKENDENKKRKAELDEKHESKKRKVQNKGKCNWCGYDKELLENKKFCEACASIGRECNWCHRPLPERFYGQRTDVCDPCITRRENYVQRGGNVKINALDGTVETTTIHPSPGNLWDVLLFFVDNQELIADILLQTLKQKTGIKWFLTLHVKFVKYNENNETVYAEPTFRSYTAVISNASQSEDEIASSLRKLHNDFQNFERDGSGWSIDKIIKMEVHTSESKPLNASSYVPLPARIGKKKAVLNIVNNDEKCFKWSLLASLHPVSHGSHPHRVSNYIQYETELNCQNIEMPVSLDDVSKFEHQNNMSINVFGLEKDEIYPLSISKSRHDKHVNLLLISDKYKRHYCLIKSMSRLLGDRTKHDGETFYCNYCLHGYTTKELLENHSADCKQHGAQKVTFPQKEENQWINFTSINKQLKIHL